MDYSQLLGFPIEFAIAALICYTVLEIVKHIVASRKAKSEATQED